MDCYTALRYEANRAAASDPSGPAPPLYDPLVSAQLVLYLSESNEVSKLPILLCLYKNKMNELGRIFPHLNATRFKQHLLQHLPHGWASFSRGRDVYLTHSDTVSEALAQSSKQSEINQDEALILMRAAGVLRKHVLVKQDPFTGAFLPDCASKLVPDPLLTFMNVLLQGPKGNIERSSHTGEGDAGMDQRCKVACGLSQLIIYNMVKTTSSSEKAVQMRHRRERETPFPLYIGIKLHSDTRLKHLVKTFNQLGLAVSYPRVREVKLAVARCVCKQIQEDGVVLPTNMRSGVFTSGDFDNLDHKKTSNLSNDEFHGLAITLIYHLSKENMEVAHEPLTIDSSDSSKPKLPDSYVIVPPVELTDSELFVPIGDDDRIVRPSHDRVQGSRVRDEAWVNHVSGLVYKEELEKGDMATWSGFHSQLQDATSLKQRTRGSCLLSAASSSPKPS